ncbi:MAG: ParB/RepB/Spo0J family partition protein, partial [Flavobacteriales bacterium]
QTGIRDGFVSMGHGRTLVNVEKREDQIALYEKIVGQNLSVRDTEKAVKDYQDALENPDKQVKKVSKIPDFIKKDAPRFSDYLSVKVDVKASEKGNGKITIPFSSEEEFQRIKKLITGE